MTEIDPNLSRLIAFLAERDVATETLTQAEWEHLIALAQHHHVAPVLYARLKQRSITPPPAIAARLRQLYIVSASRNLRLFQELSTILRALQAANIPVIPLKGAALAEAVYGNIALRSMGDLDLLVKPSDLAQALSILSTLGYAANRPFEIETELGLMHHMPRLYKSGDLQVEIHWTIIYPGYKARFRDDDLPQLWSRAIRAKIGGVQSQMLAPVDLLLHLCMHASVHHRFDGAGLRDYVDVALVIQRSNAAMDWAQFIERANRWGIANGVRLALQLATEWTDAKIPASVWTALDAAPLDESIEDWVRQKILNGNTLALKSKVVRLEGNLLLVDKLQALREVVFPSRQIMSTKYPASANSWRIWFYYPVRFKHLWKLYSRAMWQLFRRDKKMTTAARQEARMREYLGWD